MERKGYGKTSVADLDAIFAALADPTRRAMLSQLAKGEATVAALAEPFAISQPAISKHLKVLETAGLILRDRDAQKRPSRLNIPQLGVATRWLSDHERLVKPQPLKKESPADQLVSTKKKKKKDKPKRSK